MDWVRHESGGLLPRWAWPEGIDELAAEERRRWQRDMQRAREEGPVASRQYFRELLEPVATADPAAAITGTAEAGLFPAGTYTSLPANSVRPGQLYALTVAGVMTTPVTPLTMTITPRWGTTTGGTSLGASVASANMTASKTNVPWKLDALLAIRTIGSAGTAVCVGNFQCDQVGINALNFGGGSTAVDTTTAQGLFIGMTLGAAGDTMTYRIIAFEALN